MTQRRDVVEATVGEGRAVVALGRGDPAEDAAEPVVVVVPNETGQRLLGIGETGKALPIEDFGLEHSPKGLDLAIGPRRADLGAKVIDVQVAQPFAEAGEHVGHPDDEGLTVVAHQLQWPATELEALLQPDQDRSRRRLGKDTEANHEPGIVVDQADDPGLDVAPSAQVDKEGPFDVSVPELIGAGPLIAWPWARRDASSSAALQPQETIDVVMSDSVDLAAGHLRGDALRIPVREQSDSDDHLVHPGGNTWAQPKRPPRAINEPLDPVRLKRSDPLVKRRAPTTELVAGGVHS